MSEIFWSFFITSIIAFLIAVVRMCYKSKCEEIKCCGLIIKRNVILEENYDEIELRQQTKIKNTESKDDLV